MTSSISNSKAIASANYVFNGGKRDAFKRRAAIAAGAAIVVLAFVITAFNF